MKAKKSIGIIGFGNMGSAIALRLKRHYRILVFDKVSRKIKLGSGIKSASSIEDLVSNSEIVILAVKPQNISSLLKKIKTKLEEEFILEDKLIISIAAGISTGYIQGVLGKVKVVRAMPNMPAKLGKGISCLAKGRFAKAADLKLAEAVFKRLGKTLILKETMIDPATAVSGSGPGYFYDFIESGHITGQNIPQKLTRKFKVDLQKAAECIGFNEEEAHALASSTTNGSADVFEVSGLTPSQLRKQVVSKGGTTEAGLKVLAKGGSLTDAVKAALKRAKELAKK